MEEIEQVIIIKTEPRIDVLRATSILGKLEKRHPQSLISWITSRRNRLILTDNENIDHLLNIEDGQAVALALNRRFDALYGFDYRHGVADLAELIKANKKYGICIDSEWKASLYSESAAEIFTYEVSRNEFNRNCSITYQQVLYKAAHLPLEESGEMIYKLKPQAESFARQFASEYGIRPGKVPVVIICLGYNPLNNPEYYPSRSVSFLAEYLIERLNAKVILLAGPREKEIYQRFFFQCPPAVIDGGCKNSFTCFTGLISLADIVVSADNLGLHLALALGKKVVALLGQTPANEIELYGRGVVLTGEESDEFEKGTPYRILGGIKPEDAFNAVNSLL